MLQDIKACLFDLDGTLIDSMWMWDEIDEEYLKRFGYSIPPDLNDHIEGMSFSETAVYFKKRFLIPHPVEAIKSDWNRMARQNYEHKVTLKEGVSDVLKLLLDKGIRMGICTSNSRELVDIVVRRFGLDRYFSSVCTSCEVEKGKPAPDIYIKVAGNLGVHPNHCLVFEDVPNGVRAGIAAGMKTCIVYDHTSAHAFELSSRLADYNIRSFRDISRTLSGGGTLS